MKLLPAVLLLAATLLAGCFDSSAARLPSPQEPDHDSVGYICHMSLTEHAGPRGQIFLKGVDKPLWFSSVRDIFTYTTMDEENQAIAAIYVNDMGRASWDKPEPGTWVEARKAVFVADSDKTAGMGGSELAPFTDRKAAEAFLRDHGGRILTFDQAQHLAKQDTGIPVPEHSNAHSH